VEALGPPHTRILRRPHKLGKHFL